MQEAQLTGSIVQDRYRILSVLGQGGSGITYEAEETETGLRVALKELSLKGISDWKKLQLFEREAQILENLDHHAIPSYLDYFQIDTADNRFFYIVQELAEGKSLADLVAVGERFPEAEVRRISLEVLQILQYLHGLNPPVIHRDIKPQNVIRKADGQIFLVDFGAVQTVHRETAAFGSTVVGTYGYMPPEQFRGQAYPTTDLYALGATLLHLLTHRNPGDLPQSRLKYAFRPYANVSEPFAKWLDGLLEPLAEDRFDSASTALAALTNPPPDRVQSSRAISQQSSTTSLPKPPRSFVELTRSRQYLYVKIPLYDEPGCVQVLGLIFSLITNVFFLIVAVAVFASAGLVGFVVSLLFLVPSASVTMAVLRVPAKKVSISLEMMGDRFILTGYRRWRTAEGKVKDLQGVEIRSAGYETYYSPKEITLYEGRKMLQFGGHLNTDEKEWIVSEIRAYLQEQAALRTQERST
ncbi:MAG: serine/threonine-protein kinase [Cyanobacteria bacterium J06636_16]